MLKSIFFHYILVFGLILSCAQNEDDSSGGGSQNPASSNYELILDFERIPNSGLDSIRVIVTIKNNGENSIGTIPSIETSKGSLGEVRDNGDGTYLAIITPDQTGEHKVTVSYEGVSIERTPLVLYDVHSDWGQPMSVSGLVNTDGYEDGVTITPDGEYLFVQTGPQYHGGIFVMTTSRANNGCGGAFNRLTPTRCSHRWLDTLAGPYTAPERPGFFAGRFSGNTILHNSNSWGIGNDEAPNYAFSTMFYGFKRQSDGTFTEPFYLAFTDVEDGIQTPFGLSFILNGDGTARTFFTFDDPTDPDMVDFDNNGTDDAQSYFDVYETTITFGQNNNFGDFIVSGTPGTHPVRGSTFNSTLVDFGKTGLDGIAGTQGNPHVYAPNGIVESIWTDDEYDSGGDHGELSVYILDSGDTSSGSWTKVQLPSKINVADPSNEIQPFFTGTGLYFTRSGVSNPEVYYISYSGAHTAADFADNNNWGSLEKVLAMDPGNDKLGQIVAVGEPTIAEYQGDTYLYFVYVIFRELDALPPVGTGVTDLNFQAGYIKLNN